MEVQAYPTGFISALRAEKAVANKFSYSFRIGYNYIRHGDAGEHDDERGNGIGFSYGKRQFITRKFLQGYFFGLRADLWYNNITWKDNNGINVESGRTHVLVFQPTLETGYQWALADQKLIITPTLAFGFERNFSTIGEPVGQGWILLAGFNIARRF